MLNLFASTGHISYAKSARLYLQLMKDLPTSHPWLYSQFAEHRHHFIRRTENFWAGLWPDLVIEQVLMRSIKNRGGLTRGRGMSPSVCMLWVRSMNYCGSLHQAMTSLTDHHHSTSHQHEELGVTRISCDYSDLQKILKCFEDMDPFDMSMTTLRSLSTGLTANQSVNCDNADEIGEKIHEKLSNINFTKCSIKYSEQVVTLGTMKNIV